MINKKIFNKMKPFVEDKLKNYPFYLISIEMSGLGTAMPADVIIDKNISPSDPVGQAVVNDQYKRTILNAINYVYDKLNDDSKIIIDHSYFRDDKSRDEVIDELKISKNKYYSLKNMALYKFMIGLGCC